MCILLYVKLILCNGIPYDLWLIGGGTCALSICTFCYMQNLCDVVRFHRSMAIGGGTSALGI